MNGACNSKINFGAAPWGSGRGQKGKYHLISITKSISKIFMPNFVCVLTNERYKTYKTRLLFCHLGHAQGWDFCAWGTRGSKGQFFFKHGHVTYQIDKGDEQNCMQVEFLS